MMHDYTRRFFAELLGTFMLVFFGCAAVVMNAFPGANMGILGVAFAHAIALSVAVTATMNISGGHLNPAVTLGFLAVRRITLPVAGVHLAAQVVAAGLAALALKMVLPAGVARVVSYGLPELNLSVSLAQGIGIEALLTFILMSAIYGTAVAPTAPRVGGFGIGLTLLFLILGAGPLTGAAMNPARALGPAFAAGNFTAHAVYWIGPVLGALAAAFFWEKIMLGGTMATRNPATATAD